MIKNRYNTLLRAEVKNGNFSHGQDQQILINLLTKSNYDEISNENNKETAKNSNN